MKADRGGFSASHRWGVHAQRCARSPGDAPHTLFRGSHGDSGTVPARGCCSGYYLPPVACSLGGQGQVAVIVSLDLV